MCIYINNMRPKIRLGVTWSLKELQKLVNDENSCVCMKRSRKHVALHPIHLNDLNKAFQDILDSSINVYDSQFKGLLLAYKNPKLISQLGTILYDSHFIHVDLEADFYIFSPEVQRVLSGVVNKKAENYIGVLVHKVFNVSITKREEEENWKGDYLEVGDDVTFTIEHVDLKGKLPFIRGELLSNGTSTRTIPSTATSHTFFNSDEELDNDDTVNALETVNESNKTNASKHLSFFNTTNSDSSDQETQTVKNVKYSKPLESSSQDEEKGYEKQSSFESTVITRDEDKHDPVILNGTSKSKKSSKKDKKKNSKDKEHGMEDENDVLHDNNTFNESENTSTTKNEISVKKSKKRKYENAEESSSSEPLPKIRKHKKNHRISEDDKHHINDEEERVIYKDNEIETSRILVEEETTRKSSKKKHKEKIKIEQNDKPPDFNDVENNFPSFSSDIDHSRDSTQEERPSKSSKKSSKHKSKLKQKIKEERPDSPTYSGHEKEYKQTLETDYQTNRSTELSEREDKQTDVSSHNNSNNDTDITQNFTEFEVPIKSAKKKKRSSTGDNFFAVKIKEEPVSDVENGSSKKSKRKRKNRENDSSNDLDTGTLETDSSQDRKQKTKEKESVSETLVGKIKVKQEFIIKEEASKKKKHKEGNQSTLNIKQESTSSDVEGTAVKKKIKTLFTE